MVANVWSTPIGYFITMLSRQPCSAVWQLVSQVIKDASCLLNIENTLTFFSIFFFLSTKHFYRSFYWYSWQLLPFITNELLVCLSHNHKLFVLHLLFE
jgi:hypothetical protein